jgi:chemotaxis protein histidine kinase CheA
MRSALYIAVETPAHARAIRDEQECGAWSVEELDAIWQRQQEGVRERIYTIECALDALAEGHLDPDLVRDSQRAAHTLAGSVGTFGFVQASHAARAIELELEHPRRDRALVLAALLLEVRAGVAGPVRLCP